MNSLNRRDFLTLSFSAAVGFGLGRLVPSAQAAWVYPNRTADIVPASGLSKAELLKLLDEAEAQTAGLPYIVTRTKQIAVIADHARLTVNPKCPFIDWFPEQDLLIHRRNKREYDFAMSRPELVKTANWTRGTHGAFVSHLDTSHTCPDWESVLSLGLTGIRDRAKKRLPTAQTDEERTFLNCVVETYESLIRFARRWADIAEGRGAEQTAATLREIAAHEPRTLRQALQLMLFYDRCQEMESECVRSQGLMDRLYIGFYRADLAAGRETRASAKELLRAVFDVFHLQHHPNGKNIALGGYDGEGKAVWNEITELAFELHYERNLYNPKFTYRYGEKTPREHLLKVAKCFVDGRSSIVLFNEEVLREMFLRRGKDPADIANAILVGCYEPGIQGREIIASMSAWLNMVKPFEAVFNNGRDFEGHSVGLPCAVPKTYAQFESEYIRQLLAMTDRALALSCVYERAWYELNPSPIMSGSFRDAIANARDAYRGALKYNQSGVMCGGLATVADSLAAVRYLVDEKKLVTMAELGAILRANWQGHEELRLKASREPPKWGNGDDRADLLGKKIYDTLSAHINAKPNGHGGTFQAGFWSIYIDMDFGRLTAATPNGRKNGEKLSRNNVATAGCGREGPTALVASCAKLDQANSPDGFILDAILPASAQKDPAAVERVATFIQTAGAMGTQCLNLNCFNSTILREATAHPEKYPDLQVRVCGWNVMWSDLSETEKQHFIATAEAQE